ncbi:ATP synthase gamma chain [Bacteroides reticulotermitis JCM 10512]|uniref:ATP synthase gamma chain n=1 Tax=Bacteroides reticulotermitis JCM 10512 TaxID=1445607 RepID=W4UQJ6_9BACE|nr:ATP synthase gamma chain [Bacteroides reticulotermitis JCM 10512]
MLPYQKKLNKILSNFLSADLSVESPFVKEREVKRVALWLFLRIHHFVVLTMPMS